MEKEYEKKLEELKNTEDYQKRSRNGKKKARKLLKVKLGMRPPEKKHLKHKIQKRGYVLGVLLNIKSMKGLKSEIDRIKAEKESFEKELAIKNRHPGVPSGGIGGKLWKPPILTLYHEKSRIEI